MMDILFSLTPIFFIGIPFVLWIMMLVHATKNDIPNKPIWILALILGNVVGGIVYYFAVYKDASRKGNGTSMRSLLIKTAVILIVIAAPLIIFSAAPPPAKYSELSISEVISRANSGQIKSIDIKGDELLITNQGDSKPTARSRKDKGSSLYQQGLTNKNVIINVKTR